MILNVTTRHGNLQTTRVEELSALLEITIKYGKNIKGQWNIMRYCHAG